MTSEMEASVSPTEYDHPISAYRAAWGQCVVSGTFQDEVLLDALQAVVGPRGDGSAENEAAEREIYLDLWRRRVPPERMERELKRSLRRGLWRAVRGGLRGLRGTPKPLRIPSRVNMTSWSGDLFDLDLVEDEASRPHRDAVARLLIAEGPDEDGEYVADFWLREDPGTRLVHVMVGSEAIGLAALTSDQLALLRKHAADSRSLHGSFSYEATGEPRFLMSVNVPE